MLQHDFEISEPKTSRIYVLLESCRNGLTRPRAWKGTAPQPRSNRASSKCRQAITAAGGKQLFRGAFSPLFPGFAENREGGKKKQIAPCELPIPADTSVGCSESHHSSRFPSSGKFGSEESRETLQLAISRLILINDQFSRIKTVAICARD